MVLIGDVAGSVGLDIQKWAQTAAVTLAWEVGEGDSRLRGWEGNDGLRAIETNAHSVWSEATDLPEPFDRYWDARLLSPSVLVP